MFIPAPSVSFFYTAATETQITVCQLGSMVTKRCSKMKPISLLFAFIVLVCALTQGNALKCYEYSCSNTSMPGIPLQSDCPPRKEITCKPLYGLPMAPDRCSIRKMKMNISNIIVSSEVGNCSYSYICPDMCRAALNGTKCDSRCCEGDLCNGSPIPTSAPTPKPTGPVGKDLSCYVCSSTKGSPTESNCDNPARKTCGMNPMGKPQDRCITLTGKVRSPDGKLHESVMRNCSSSWICHNQMICKWMPNTTDCKVSCCEGNLCNSSPTSAPTIKPAGHIGKDLSCYVCGSTKGSPSESNCDNPKKKTCGMDLMGNPQDRCITLTAKVRSPHGKLHDSVMRNCSSSWTCKHMKCSLMPNVTDCKLSCCEGNLCNKIAEETPNDSMKAMASTILVLLLSVGVISRL